jgi:hypothetical protein
MPSLSQPETGWKVVLKAEESTLHHRVGHTMLAFGNFLYIFGGRSGDNSEALFCSNRKI